jgi:hypothetical protein
MIGPIQMLGEWAAYVSWEPIKLKDFLLGVFLALALRRGRIRQLLDKVTPTSVDDNS